MLIFVFIIAYFLSSNKKNIKILCVLRVLGLEIVFTYLFIKIQWFSKILYKIVELCTALQVGTTKGVEFVFGYLSGVNLPFNVTNNNSLFLFAFQAIPIIIVISALFNVLFHLNILQKIMNVFMFFFKALFGIDGFLPTIAGAKIFTDHMTCPIMFSKVLDKFKNTDISFMIISGFTVASPGILIIYSSILNEHIKFIDMNIPSDAMFHLLLATMLGVFSSIVMALIVFPCETDKKQSRLEKFDIETNFKSTYENVFSAMCDGALTAANICTKIIVISLTIVAMLAFVNMLLSYLFEFLNFILNSVSGVLYTYCNIKIFTDVTVKAYALDELVGCILYPVFLLFNTDYTLFLSELFSLKIISNEIIAYSKYVSTCPEKLSDKSQLIAIYTIFGFCNISSVLMVNEALKTLCNQITYVYVCKVIWKCFIISILASFLSSSLVVLFI